MTPRDGMGSCGDDDTLLLTIEGPECKRVLIRLRGRATMKRLMSCVCRRMGLPPVAVRHIVIT